jgi:hypothetical protein
VDSDHVLAKVRVAGSNPVVRSTRNPCHAGVSSRTGPESQGCELPIMPIILPITWVAGERSSADRRA